MLVIPLIALQTSLIIVIPVLTHSIFCSKEFISIVKWKFLERSSKNQCHLYLKKFATSSLVTFKWVLRKPSVPLFPQASVSICLQSLTARSSHLLLGSAAGCAAWWQHVLGALSRSDVLQDSELISAGCSAVQFFCDVQHVLGDFHRQLLCRLRGPTGAWGPAEHILTSSHQKTFIATLYNNCITRDKNSRGKD